MAKKTGLGKGLDALFGGDLINEEIEENEDIKDGEKITKIKLTEIEPNRNQPRKKFDEESLEELAESIKTYGVIQPIVVSIENGYYHYELVCRTSDKYKKEHFTEKEATGHEIAVYDIEKNILYYYWDSI